MHVEVISDAGCIADAKVRGKTAVVIDVLRATSVMCAALHNGAARIIPVTTVEECEALSGNLRSCLPGVRVLRGGERNTYRIDGFELDNSPLAYNRETVEGATIVMTTTNGTRTINNCRSAAEILVGSLLNASSVAAAVAEAGRDAVLVCSGRRNAYTMEDGFCAGKIAGILADRYGFSLSDLAWQERDFHDRFADDPRQALQHCEHYRNISVRLADDVAFCLQNDIYSEVPKIYGDENGNTQEIR